MYTIYNVIPLHIVYTCIYIHMYIPTYIQAHTYIPTYIQAHMYIHTYMHTYIHREAYIHACICTYVCPYSVHIPTHMHT